MKINRCLLAVFLLCLPVLLPDAVTASDNDPGSESVSDSRLTVRYRGSSDILANEVQEHSRASKTDG